ncbi:hypothetical protein ACFOG5_12500 [Pedobacter fastidiosus]|uniref:hypothetical protein n=1 Tax=Pedobacter fastidiosus TaxID=2765361 RepID=UPI00164EACA1|nr:hypothetical protein [Pedobacter fastidiosus]
MVIKVVKTLDACKIYQNFMPEILDYFSLTTFERFANKSCQSFGYVKNLPKILMATLR